MMISASTPDRRKIPESCPLPGHLEVAKNKKLRYLKTSRRSDESNPRINRGEKKSYSVLFFSVSSHFLHKKKTCA